MWLMCTPAGRSLACTLHTAHACFIKTPTVHPAHTTISSFSFAVSVTAIPGPCIYSTGLCREHSGSIAHLHADKMLAWHGGGFPLNGSGAKGMHGIHGRLERIAIRTSGRVMNLAQ